MKNQYEKVLSKSTDYSEFAAGFSFLDNFRGGQTIFNCHSHSNRLLVVGRYLMEGLSNHQIQTISGVWHGTVQKVRIQIEKVRGKIKCPCGRHSSHSGTCKFRLEFSEKRKKYYREMIKLPKKKCPTCKVEFQMKRKNQVHCKASCYDNDGWKNKH